MKIDIHMHTRKVKSGDSINREIEPQQFCDTILSTDVRICAITNHNLFDIEQYKEIIQIANKDILVWPGVELDIDDNGKRGHLLVIVNPSNFEEFYETIFNMTKGKNLDEFMISINDTVKIFDVFEPIYIPHFLAKSPSISNETIDVLQNMTANSHRVLKEATNSISAGIFVSHGHRTIYGSDITNWDEYFHESKKLPDVRLPIESFDQFCLLLDRDDSAIETLLDRKKKQKITLQPFKDDKDIELEIYDDINILFGSKGTGKTEILKALSKYYNKEGYRTEVFESNAKLLSKQYDLNGNEYNIDLSQLPIDSCQNEIEFIRTATDSRITSIRKYFDYYSETETNKASKKITIRNLQKTDENIPEIKLNEINELDQEILKFHKLLNSKTQFREVIGSELFDEFITVLSKVEDKILEGLNTNFNNFYTAVWFNKMIELFTNEVARKTGKPIRPTSTGFQSYASNRIEIEKAAKKIIKNLQMEIKPVAEFVGDLGEKGNLFCNTILKVQNGEISDSSFKHLDSTTKNPQRYVAGKFFEIEENLYTDDLFKKIDELNGIENGNTIFSIENLILFKRVFEVNHQEYTPSNGESAMILLTRELHSEKDIYLIDEPEKSLGNDYINDFIVPLLKEHAYTGKQVIIATHDANIAVRTLPYRSIYREHSIDSYFTYLGNPFSNNLICSESGKKLDWKEMSMKTLEGGKDAFGERGKIYGNT